MIMLFGIVLEMLDIQLILVKTKTKKNKLEKELIY